MKSLRWSFYSTVRARASFAIILLNRTGRLLLAWENLLPEVSEPLTHHSAANLTGVLCRSLGPNSVSVSGSQH
jgi:hypothetical protein